MPEDVRAAIYFAADMLVCRSVSARDAGHGEMADEWDARAKTIYQWLFDTKPRA